MLGGYVEGAKVGSEGGSSVGMADDEIVGRTVVGESVGSWVLVMGDLVGESVGFGVLATGELEGHADGHAVGRADDCSSVGPAVSALTAAATKLTAGAAVGAAMLPVLSILSSKQAVVSALYSA